MHMAACMVAAVSLAAGSEDLTVLDAGQPATMLYKHLAGEAYEALQQRRKQYEQLETREECRAWQQRRQTFFRRQLGGFPERTPLNAQMVGEIDGDGYRIEKILYESRPNHHVTALLYLPKSEPPYPGVLIASGHSTTGKAAGYNQKMGLLLAKNGMAALAYDPVGQGERSQILTADGQRKYSSTTLEHFLMGVGSILVGTNTAQYRIYDGLRGLDYLADRPDIDAERLGCTGCSGGGTLSSYIMALDERVACAAPACYLTTFRRLIETIGPQDAEQNIFGQVAFGLDQPDYVLMRAPRPTLICATTDDFFDIQGTWDNFRQGKRFYARFGVPERIALVEDDAGHGITQLNRETMVRWMQRWLLGKDEKVQEPDLPVRTAEELQCSPDGQVLLMPEERSVFELNGQRAERLAKKRAKLWRQADEGELRRRIREMAEIRPFKKIAKPQSTQVGTIRRDGYRIEKWLLEPEAGISLPSLLFVPAEGAKKAVLYLHGQGKAAEAAPGEAIEELVQQGALVLAVDLPGMGETRGESANGRLGDWKNFFLAYLLGRSLVGLRTESIVSAVRFVEQRTEDSVPLHLVGVGVGEAGIPALHAAALKPGLFASVTLRRTLRRWSDVVTTPEAENQLTGVVHGALKVYDLSNLLTLCGRKKVSIEQPTDARGEPVSSGSKKP